MSRGLWLLHKMQSPLQAVAGDEFVYKKLHYKHKKVMEMTMAHLAPAH